MDNNTLSSWVVILTACIINLSFVSYFMISDLKKRVHEVEKRLWDYEFKRAKEKS